MKQCGAFSRMWPGVLCCLLIAVVYVSCLYVKRTPASRQHPETVKWRIIAVLVASSMAWWPVYIRRQQVLYMKLLEAALVFNMQQL